MSFDKNILNNKHSNINDLLDHIESVINNREERLVSEERRVELKKTPTAILLSLIYSNELINSDNLLDNVFILLEKRSMQMSKNPGDMAFPGGKSEAGDRDLFDTACREAKEEVGLEPSSLKFIGYMDEYVSSSNLIVRAVVTKAKLDIPMDNFREVIQKRYRPRTDESEHTVVIPISHCLDPKYYSTKAYSIPNGRTGYIRFIDIDKYLEHTRIWGLTATIIRRFIDIVFPDNILIKEP